MELLIIVFAICFIVLGTLKFKIDPFIMLILAALLCGFGFGMPSAELLDVITKGFGSTLSSIGIVIVLGAIIGVFLEKSNGIDQIVSILFKFFGVKRSGLMLNVAGFITAIPVFCDAAFVILSAIPKELSKKTGVSLSFYGVALATGLYAAHVFIPPTPGPLAAAAILQTPLSSVLGYGLVVSIPVSLCGYVFSLFFNKKASSQGIYKTEVSLFTSKEATKLPKYAITSFLPILVPIVLIGVSSFYKVDAGEQDAIISSILFLGHPVVATLFGVVVSFVISKKETKETRSHWVLEAITQAGVIILITGAGGAFGAVLKSLNLSEFVSFSSNSPYLGLLMAFGFAALIKTAQGSSTVSILTTSAFMLPLLAVLGLSSEIGRCMTVLAIGSGAMTLSHINDSYFWVVTKSLGLEVKEGMYSFSLATFFQGITGIVVVLLLYSFLQ